MEAAVLVPPRRFFSVRSVLLAAAVCLLLLVLFGMVSSSRLTEAVSSVRSFTASALELTARVDELVCIASADPILMPASRGTAEALWHLAQTLAHAGLRTHVILISQSTSACADSLHQILLHSWESGERITASCVHLGSAPGVALPLVTRERFAQHWSALPSSCQVLVSHEWWAPALDFLAAGLLGANASLLPTAVANFHGGNLWSISWRNASLVKYADLVMDASERMSAHLNHHLVFPNGYMRDLHAGWAHTGDQLVIPNIAGLVGGGRAQGGGPQPVLGVAYVGSVEERKGIDVLVRVLAGLAGELRRVRLEIFGSMEVEVHGQEAQEWIRGALKGAPHVRCTIHGPHDAAHLWPLLKERKLLLVMPTLLENQPMTLIHAAAHGVPVLSYDVGGIADMLTPASRAQVLIPPDPAALRASLLRLLKAKAGYAPTLRPQMASAQGAWVALIRRALREAKARRAAGPAPPPPPVRLVRLTLAGELGTQEVAEMLRRAGPGDAVLLSAPGFDLLPGEAATLERALSVALSEPRTAGLVSSVRMGDGSRMVPQAPFYLLSSGWYNCAPSAPLALRRSLLERYLDEQAGSRFQPWLLTLWLLYGGEAEGNALALLTHPRPLFSFSGCLDALACFWGEEEMPLPPALLADSRALAHSPVPPARIARRLAAFEANFSALIQEECAEAGGDSAWALAARSPRLCPGTLQHGPFTLAALKTALLHACTGFCPFLMGEHPTGVPLPSVGWSLDSARSCWREVGTASTCQPWFAQRARTPAGSFACFAPKPQPPPPAEPADAPPCDLMLSAEEHPPGGRCAPRLLVAGFQGCGAPALSALLALHPQAGGEGGAAPTPAQRAARREFYAAEGGEASQAQRWAYASTFGQEGGALLDDTPASMLPRPGTPARLRRLLPTARVAMVVCEPAARALAAWGGGEGERLGAGVAARQRLGGSFEMAVSALLNGSLGGARVGAESAFFPGSLQQLLLEQGYYALHLMDWLGEFGSQAVMVVHAERLRVDAAGAARELFAFLGLPPADEALEGGAAAAAAAPHLPLQTVERAEEAPSLALLGGAYGTYNRWLSALLGNAEYPLRWPTGEATTETEEEGER